MDNNDSSGYQLPNVDDNQVADDVQSQTPGPVLQPEPVLIVPTQHSYDPSMPMQAGDIDLIEKAWVEKAKAIVRSTHGDPYSQNKEMNKVKADYIRKRYNKDIRVSE